MFLGRCATGSRQDAQGVFNLCSTTIIMQLLNNICGGCNLRLCENITSVGVEWLTMHTLYGRHNKVAMQNTVKRDVKAVGWIWFKYYLLHGPQTEVYYYARVAIEI
eukprot:8381713-Pyramimonas_sp.AAC.1